MAHTNSNPREAVFWTDAWQRLCVYKWVNGIGWHIKCFYEPTTEVNKMTDELDDNDSVDLDTGDHFTADYTPDNRVYVTNEQLDVSGLGHIIGVRVRVLDFSDDQASYEWEIISPQEVADDLTLRTGFGFDAFTKIREITQDLG